MATSSTTTSGLSLRAMATACRPVSASPTTLTSPEASSSTRRPSRITVWSSARRTLILGFSSILLGCRRFVHGSSWRRISSPRHKAQLRTGAAIHTFYSDSERIRLMPRVEIGWIPQLQDGLTEGWNGATDDEYRSRGGDDRANDGHGAY